MKTRILFRCTILCAAVASLQIAHAATITVMNTNDGVQTIARPTRARMFV